jgi:cyanophycinase
MQKRKRKVDQTCPVPAGMLLIIGGKENKGEDGPPERDKPNGFVSEDILRLFCDHIKEKKGTILVITSGSAEGSETFAEYKKVFGGLGRHSTVHIHHDTRKDLLEDEKLMEQVKDAKGIFFSGGDQLLLTSIYGGTKFLTQVKEKYIAQNIIIGGTSAGAMAMSTPMIYAGNEEKQQLSGEIKVTTGLEFLKDVCIDTHFVHRGRFVRLAQVIATSPGCTGIGIEEDTAILIRNGVEAEVKGSGTVIVVEGFSITEADMKKFTEKKPFSVRNLKVDILAPDDKFSIQQLNPIHK